MDLAIAVQMGVAPSMYVALEMGVSDLTFSRMGLQYGDLKEKDMDSVFIITFLVLAPALFRRQIRGVCWDWKVWVSLIIAASLGVVLVFPGLCGKPLPYTLILPEPVALAAMVVLFIVFLAPPVWQLLDELQRRRNRGPSSDDPRE